MPDPDLRHLKDQQLYLTVPPYLQIPHQVTESESSNPAEKPQFGHLYW